MNTKTPAPKKRSHPLQWLKASPVLLYLFCLIMGSHPVMYSGYSQVYIQEFFQSVLGVGVGQGTIRDAQNESSSTVLSL